VAQQPDGQPRRTHRVQPGDGTPPPPASPFAARQAGVPPQQPVPPSLEVLQAKLENLIAENQARFQALAEKGAPPDPFYLVHARINHLIDMIASATGPNGPRWAAMTRLGFEEMIARELEAAGPQLQRMQLAEGGRYTPAMIADLARQTRTLRRTH